mmetsp:Transcript_12113/g.23018  ORF Transcript_12113/g.23018 Transcript_12113/m.23018 type:complete len:352 (-) Transcript_12113:1371-2426(-)
MNLAANRLVRVHVHRLHEDAEHAVRATAVLVHVGGEGAAVAVARLDGLHHVLHRRHRARRQARHLDAVHARVLHLQRLRLGVRGEQVVDVLVVDLQVACADGGPVVLLALLAHSKQLPQCTDVHPWVVVRARHGVCLATSRLPVGKDGHIVTVHHAGDEGLDLRKHRRLVLIRTEHALVGERLFVALVTLDCDFLIADGEPNHRPKLPVPGLPSKKRAHAAKHANVPAQVHQLVVQLLARHHLRLVERAQLLDAGHVHRRHEPLHLLLHVREHLRHRLRQLRLLRAQRRVLPAQGLRGGAQRPRGGVDDAQPQRRLLLRLGLGSLQRLELIVGFGELLLNHLRVLGAALLP